MNKSDDRQLKTTTMMIINTNRNNKSDHDEDDHDDRLENLDMSGKSLTKLSRDLVINGQNLISINFSKNQLTSLDGDIFRAMKSLKEMNFSENMLSNLDPNLFKGLTNLISVNFSHNQITQLSEGIFLGAPNLQFIDFSYNFITTLDPLLFIDLTNLTLLNFSFNRIISLSPMLFNNNNRKKVNKLIGEINFSHNQIADLDAEIFKELINLKRLDFSGNQIKALSSNIFKGLKSLEAINFSRNQLDQLSPLSSSLSNLKTIDFSFNRMSQIEPGIFDDLQMLESIDFRGNLNNAEQFVFWDDEKLLNEFFCVLSNSTKISIRSHVFVRYAIMLLLDEDKIVRTEVENVRSILDLDELKNVNLLDLLLGLKRISNKVLVKLIDKIDSLQANTKPDNFNVARIKSLLYICDRNSEELTLKLGYYFDLPSFRVCFNEAAKNKNETVSCCLVEIYWRKIVKEFYSLSVWAHDGSQNDNEKRIFMLIYKYEYFLNDTLSFSFSLKWWQFYEKMLDVCNIDANLKIYYLMMFERDIYFYNKSNVIATSSSLRNCQVHVEMMETSSRRDEFLINPDSIRSNQSKLIEYVSKSNQSNLIQHETIDEMLTTNFYKFPFFLKLYNIIIHFTYLLSFIFFFSDVHLYKMYLGSTASNWYFLFSPIFFLFSLAQALFFIQVERLALNIICLILCTITLYYEHPTTVVILFFIAIAFNTIVFVSCFKVFEIFGIYIRVIIKILTRSLSLSPLLVLVLYMFLFAFRVCHFKSLDDGGGENSSYIEDSNNETNTTTSDLDNFLFDSTISYGAIRILTMGLGEYNTDQMGLEPGINGSNFLLYILYVLFIFIFPILIINIFIGISIDELRKMIEISHNQSILDRMAYVLRLQEASVYWMTNLTCLKSLTTVISREMFIDIAVVNREASLIQSAGEILPTVFFNPYRLLKSIYFYSPCCKSQIKADRNKSDFYGWLGWLKKWSLTNIMIKGYKNSDDENNDLSDPEHQEQLRLQRLKKVEEQIKELVHFLQLVNVEQRNQSIQNRQINDRLEEISKKIVTNNRQN